MGLFTKRAREEKIRGRSSDQTSSTHRMDRFTKNSTREEIHAGVTQYARDIGMNSDVNRSTRWLGDHWISAGAFGALGKVTDGVYAALQTDVRTERDVFAGKSRADLGRSENESDSSFAAFRDALGEKALSGHNRGDRIEEIANDYTAKSLDEFWGKVQDLVKTKPKLRHKAYRAWKELKGKGRSFSNSLGSALADTGSRLDKAYGDKYLANHGGSLSSSRTTASNQTHSSSTQQYRRRH